MDRSKLAELNALDHDIVAIEKLIDSLANMQRKDRYDYEFYFNLETFASEETLAHRNARCRSE